MKDTIRAPLGAVALCAIAALAIGAATWFSRTRPVRRALAGRAPLTLADARFTIPHVFDRPVPVGDFDGDGSVDLALLRRMPGATAEAVHERLEVVSGRDGNEIATWWQGIRRWEEELAWDAGGDLDGDGAADLAIGLSERGGEQRGVVTVVSGRSAAPLREHLGKEPGDGLGTSLAILGDVDGDGAADLGIGADQAEGWAGRTPGDDVVSGGTRNGVPYVVLRDGRKKDPVVHHQDLLARRSRRSGVVEARSGRDGSELWNESGSRPGQGFGSRVVAFGDLDGDGAPDVLVQCARASIEPVRVLSGRTGDVLLEAETRFGPAGCAGDVDADGVPDLFLDGQEIDSTSRLSGIRVVSGATVRVIASRPYPDMAGDYGSTSSLGDVDGDGHADLAVGEPNYNIRARDNPVFELLLGVQLEELSLEEALALESEPCTMGPESGVLHVYSGRTGLVIAGIYGAPGSREAVGYHATALPDVTGDGHPDLVVTSGEGAHLFAGPGRTPD